MNMKILLIMGGINLYYKLKAENGPQFIILKQYPITQLLILICPFINLTSPLI
jgi:hypothetical protein